MRCFGRMWMPTGHGQSYARSVPPQWWQEAYAQQAGEQDRAKRMAILRKMEDYLIFEDPGGSAMSYWTARGWIFNEKVKGIHASALAMGRLQARDRLAVDHRGLSRRIVEGTGLTSRSREGV